ncbi:MAG: glycosyltransferase family 4 protein [Vicinamibacterales bacterium]
MAEVVVMVTTSYPRFPGDSVGTFMEPIARSIAARGHEVHVVAPWHPLIDRGPLEAGVHLHFYKYAPIRALNIFGYAAAMKADVSLRAAAFVAAPLALAAGWRTARTVARQNRATIMHGHWVVPGGVTAAAASPGLPLVISLHGSDVYVAERLKPAGVAARAAFRRAGFVTACSADLATRAIALGADPARISVVPYGVDARRFRPDPGAAAWVRAELEIPHGVPLVAAAGRLVRKKGFEYLIDAMARVPRAVLALAGDGTLAAELHAHAESAGVADRIRFMGNRSQDEVAALFAAAELVVTPSVRDEAGNVDGLPNVVMEALASGTALVTTTAGGIGSVVEHERTALVVPEKNTGALASAISRALADDALRSRLGTAARELAQTRFDWQRTAEQFESAYRHALAFKSRSR